MTLSEVPFLPMQKRPIRGRRGDGNGVAGGGSGLGFPIFRIYCTVSNCQLLHIAYTVTSKHSNNVYVIKYAEIAVLTCHLSQMHSADVSL